MSGINEINLSTAGWDIFILAVAGAVIFGLVIYVIIGIVQEVRQARSETDR